MRKTLPLLALAAVTGLAAPAEAVEFEYRYRIVNMDSQTRISDKPPLRFTTPMNTFTLYDDSGILLAAMTGATNEENARREAIDDARRRGARTGETIWYSYANPDYVPGAKSYIRYASGAAATANVDFGTTSGGAQDYTVGAELTSLEFGAALPTLHLWGPVTLAPLWEVYWRSIKLNGPATPVAGGAPVSTPSRGVSAIQSPINAIIDVELPLGFSVRPHVGYDLVSLLDATLGGSGKHAFLYGLNASWTPGAFVRLSTGIDWSNGNFDTKAPYSALTYSVAGSVYF